MPVAPAKITVYNAFESLAICINDRVPVLKQMSSFLIEIRLANFGLSSSYWKNGAFIVEMSLEWVNTTFASIYYHYFTNFDYGNARAFFFNQMSSKAIKMSSELI